MLRFAPQARLSGLQLINAPDPRPPHPSKPNLCLPQAKLSEAVVGGARIAGSAPTSRLSQISQEHSAGGLAVAGVAIAGGYKTGWQARITVQHVGYHHGAAWSSD